MEVNFRSNGEIPPPPLAFEFSLLPDGFSITVPEGYVVTQHNLAAEGENGEEDDAEGENAEEDDAEEEFNTAQIVADSQHRLLTQGEVIFLLENDTIEVEDVQRRPGPGIHMYSMNLHLRATDGYIYQRPYVPHDIQIQGRAVRYVRKFVTVDDDEGLIVTRRYYVRNGEKILVH